MWRLITRPDAAPSSPGRRMPRFEVVVEAPEPAAPGTAELRMTVDGDHWLAALEGALAELGHRPQLDPATLVHVREGAQVRVPADAARGLASGGLPVVGDILVRALPSVRQAVYSDLHPARRGGRAPATLGVLRPRTRPSNRVRDARRVARRRREISADRRALLASNRLQGTPWVRLMTGDVAAVGADALEAACRHLHPRLALLVVPHRGGRMRILRARASSAQGSPRAVPALEGARLRVRGTPLDGRTGDAGRLRLAAGGTELRFRVGLFGRLEVPARDLCWAPLRTSAGGTHGLLVVVDHLRADRTLPPEALEDLRGLAQAACSRMKPKAE